MFLGKILDFHSVSLYTGAQIGTDEFDARGTCDGLASLPWGSRNIPSRFMLQKPRFTTFQVCLRL